MQQNPTVGIIGAGVMGAGIAQLAAGHGSDVRLLDVSVGVVRNAVAGIANALVRLVEKGKLTEAERKATLGRLRVAFGPADLASCQLVIEAVAEKLDVKLDVFQNVKAHTASDTIFASNTSSLSITALGRALGESRRMVGMHFFNPAAVMPLVEVINGEETDPAVADQVANLARAWGKTVVRASDRPGFIVNRVARGYYLEALRMLGEGIAPLDEIDRVLRDLGGFRMGPFGVMDLVGIDVNYGVSESVWQQLGRPARLRPHPLQAGLLARGDLGRKTRRGFYDYSIDPSAPVVSAERKPFQPSQAVQAAAEAFTDQATGRHGTPREDYIFSRTLVTIINEAALALDEEVASAADIDTAMRLGTNYPKGPLEWASIIGKGRCRDLLSALNDEAPDGRFTPARSLASA
jgi:3-hydroxybutyryl-CoA dehydrogenase